MKRTAAALLALALVSGACRDDRTDAAKATNALNSGLKAQVDGKTDQAARAYRKVLAHDPRNKFAFYNLGLIDQEAGRAKTATQFYRQALAVDPNYIPALFNLAILTTETTPDDAAVYIARSSVSTRATPERT